jgi:hypothetical protein
MLAAAGEGASTPKLAAQAARRAELLSALRQAHVKLGRWPTAGEWELATAEHASRRTYVRWFGSWAPAIEAAAGYAYSGLSASDSSRKSSQVMLGGPPAQVGRHQPRHASACS